MLPKTRPKTRQSDPRQTQDKTNPRLLSWVVSWVRPKTQVLYLSCLGFVLGLFILAFKCTNIIQFKIISEYWILGHIHYKSFDLLKKNIIILGPKTQHKTQDNTRQYKTKPRLLSWVVSWVRPKTQVLYLSCLGFVLGQIVLSWVLSWVRFSIKILSCLGLVMCLVFWVRNTNWNTIAKQC